jgi:RimJ/RimL family protein N-acetyltransferase
VSYWVVLLRDSNTPIGIISLVKREYLEHPDLGFAFLPEYSGKGYAFEAATAVLKTFLAHGQQRILLAVTMSKNTRSIALLGRLRFSFLKELVVTGESLLVYAIGNEA